MFCAGTFRSQMWKERAANLYDVAARDKVVLEDAPTASHQRLPQHHRHTAHAGVSASLSGVGSCSGMAAIMLTRDLTSNARRSRDSPRPACATRMPQF